MTKHPARGFIEKIDKLHFKISCALLSHMPATILIVDDEKNTREGLSLALEDDYEVYIASGAEEAFNLMEAETLT